MRFNIRTSLVNRVRSEGFSVRASSLSIKYLADDDFRYTVVVSKNKGNAVKRNRIKRIIREIMRERKGDFPNGLYVLYINKPYDQLSRETLMDDVLRLTNYLGKRGFGKEANA